MAPPKSRVAPRTEREVPSGAQQPPASSVPSEGIGEGAADSSSAWGHGAQQGSGAAGGSGAGGLGDARAYCLRCPPPRYPVLARQRNWSGAVEVALVLDATGTVQEARVERSSGFDLLDREALTAARQSRFQLPGHLPAPIRGRIVYRFELAD